MISVVMPVYNAAPFLDEAIESILNQTYPKFEFIIVDDASTDGSAEIIRKFAEEDLRIRPFFLRHSGAGGAANAGIREATGTFVARMDADDIALPERLATQLSWMRRNKVAVCGSCVKTFGAENRLIWFPEIHEAIRVEMLFRCGLMQPTVMMRADIAKAHPYKEELLFEDYELWTRLASLYRMGNVPQVLLKYRTHSRQRHVCNADDVRRELRHYSTLYFRSLVPGASVADENMMAKVVSKEPLNNLMELKRLGEIFAEFSMVNDRFLRGRLAQRWWSACAFTAPLGTGTYRLYQQMTTLRINARSRDLVLLIACLLRLPYSRITKVSDWLRKGRLRFSERP